VAKILLVIVVFAAVYFIVRTYARSVAAKRAAETVPDKAEDMVRCAHCGVHLPRSDSVASGGQSFCSKEHQRLHGP
jgi:uncharacterized protein